MRPRERHFRAQVRLISPLSRFATLPLLHEFAFSKKLHWFAPTKVISLKTPQHAVNAPRKRAWQWTLKLAINSHWTLMVCCSSTVDETNRGFSPRHFSNFPWSPTTGSNSAVAVELSSFASYCKNRFAHLTSHWMTNVDNFDPLPRKGQE